MKLTSRGRYALQAILDLAANSNGKAVKLQDISNRQAISLHYLEQLFRQLRQAGIVKSVRGPGGGYVLASVPENITVLEILVGVKELTNYGNTVNELTENSTVEHKALATYVAELDSSIVEVLNAKLSSLLGS